jgi:hypothetical protein
MHPKMPFFEWVVPAWLGLLALCVTISPRDLDDFSQTLRRDLILPQQRHGASNFRLCAPSAPVRRRVLRTKRWLMASML